MDTLYFFHFCFRVSAFLDHFSFLKKIYVFKAPCIHTLPFENVVHYISCFRAVYISICRSVAKFLKVECKGFEMLPKFKMEVKSV